MIFDHKINITNSSVVTTITEDQGEVDVKALLSFDTEGILEAFQTHAALQAYYEELSSKYKEHLENFKKITYEQWWSHCKKYAKLVLVTQGDKKPTISSIDEMVIQIFSQETSEEVRENLIKLAFESGKLDRTFSNVYQLFRADALKYLSGENPVYFEYINMLLNSLTRQYESVKTIANGLNSKAFHMQEVGRMLAQKPNNTELKPGAGFERKDWR